MVILLEFFFIRMVWCGWNSKKEVFGAFKKFDTGTKWYIVWKDSRKYSVSFILGRKKIKTLKNEYILKKIIINGLITTISVGSEPIAPSLLQSGRQMLAHFMRLCDTFLSVSGVFALMPSIGILTRVSKVGRTVCW